MDAYTSRCLSKARNIIKDNSAPGFHMINPNANPLAGFRGASKFKGFFSKTITTLDGCNILYDVITNC